MRIQSTSLLVAALLMGTAVLAVMPTAAAQTTPNLTVTVSAPGQLVKPLQGSISFSGTVNFVSESTASTQLTGVQVTYTVKNAPAWASVTISPTTDIITPTAQGGPAGPTVSGTKTFTVTVSATDQAPAFQPAPLEIQAVTAGNNAFKTATGSGSVPLEADYFALLDVALAEKIKIERPQQAVVFPLTITNLGNANTKVNFEVGDASPSLQVPVPNSVTLQSKQAGGTNNQQTVPLTVQTPYKNGYLNEVGVVNFKVTSHYALDAKKKGPDENVAVLVTTKGFYVPGFELPMLIGLLGAAALVLRRRV